MAIGKKRGRPLKPEKLEALEAAERMRTRPSWLKPPSTKKQAELHELLESMGRAESEILSQYKYSHTTSADHAYAMASVGDEVMVDSQEALLKLDARKMTESFDSKKMGGKAKKDAALQRAEKLCAINKVLLELLSPIGKLSMSDVARKILKDWSSLDPATLLVGEPTTMRRRGLAGDPPSMKTIVNYIKLASPYRVHRVGRTSLRNK